MFKRRIENTFEAKLKEKGEDYIVCDVTTVPSRYVTVPKELRNKYKKSRIRQTVVEKDVKMKFDKSNAKLVKKVKRLKCNRKFTIKISYLLGEYYQTDLWEFIDIIEEKDVLIIEKNRPVLFTGNTSLIDKRIAELEELELLEEQNEIKKEKVSKKDIEISKLKEENIQLKFQIQNLQKQLQNN